MESLAPIGIGEGALRVKLRKGALRASLVAQWKRICLPTQET